MKWFGLLAVVLLMLATILSASPAVYADAPPAGESRVAIDICITGTTQIHVVASDGSHLDVGAQGATDAHLNFTADADTVFDIYITGDGEADIVARGTCQVNVRVEGPSQVHIDAGDEVRLNVEAGDESQVFVDDQSLDNPTQTDGPVAYQESQDVDEHSSRLDSRLVIVSGAFPAAVLLAFLLIRRRGKNNIKTKETTE